MSVQLALTDPVWPCDICGRTGRELDPETGLERSCRCCEGTGWLTYDPDDHSAVPW